MSLLPKPAKPYEPRIEVRYHLDTWTVGIDECYGHSKSLSEAIKTAIDIYLRGMLIKP